MKNQKQTLNQKNFVPGHMPASEVSPARQQRLQELKQAFYKLYCFRSHEIDAYLERAAGMAEEGLQKLFDALKAGLLAQDTALQKTAARDQESLLKFQIFVKKTAKKLKNKYEVQEHSGAEKLLEEIHGLTDGTTSTSTQRLHNE